VWREAADGRGPDDQNGDADEAVEMNDMAAQRLVRNLFLVPIPDDDRCASRPSTVVHYGGVRSHL
ncbi:MAG: hypothetical protein MUP70_05150, partial [Candidatus Aminicenantes bacterium]|nr:hypothetical protein [Candidatus Aminicenantes bacterium]